MNSLLAFCIPHPPLAADMGLIYGLIFPLAGMAFALIVVITGAISKAHKQRLHHETIRLALEKGQPIPAGTFQEDRSMGGANELGRIPTKRDRRAGLILLGIAFGLLVFLWAKEGHGVQWVALIPGGIGAALLLNAMLDDSSRPPQNRS